MTAKHTPGPWYVRDDDPNSLEVRRDDENCKLVCEFPYGTGNQEDQANACLIALAPEMAELLERLERLIFKDLTETPSKIISLQLEAHALIKRMQP